MIFIIADDITGAAEVAGVCLRYGLTVSFGIDSLPDISTDVCVIATDSRSMSETEAYNIHLKLSELVSKFSPELVFKKCDSVLRGYVLTELFALMNATKQKKIVFQPSNPITGRCIRNGIYYINNKLISQHLVLMLMNY